MGESEIVMNGVNLINRSPFKSVYHDDYNYDNKDLLKFILQEQHKSKINNQEKPNFSLMNSVSLSNTLNNHLQQIVNSHKSALSKNETAKWNDFIDLKLVIENSIYSNHSPNKPSAASEYLTLDEVNHLKNLTRQQEAQKDTLKQKLDLFDEFLAKFHDSQENLPVIRKLQTNRGTVQNELNSLNEQLTENSAKLTNHYTSALMLGYIEDIQLPNKLIESFKQPESQILTSFDNLFAHIAAIAVQRSIPLPTPETDDSSINNRIVWAQHCIDTILREVPQEEGGSVEADKSLIDDGNDKLLSYKTALEDLRFSHQYLTREFEDQRENFSKVLSDYRKKNGELSKELKLAIERNVKSPNEFNAKQLEEVVEQKESEIAKLRKELNLLKIDSLGKSPRPPHSATMGTPPIPQKEGHSFNSNSRPLSTDSTSAGILRKEFKKLVEQIQNQYEVELNNEKIERRRLQNLVKLYEKNRSTFSENDDTL